jgi:2-polyprenyl-3-methyl-5-hydroxy-6-metoxy-1,4-benzoquinol methylase
MSSCPVCKTKLHFVFEAKVLKKYDVRYFQCPHCELLKTEEPHWLNEAYQNAIIDADTGLVQRNNRIAKKIAGIIYFLLDKNASYLDVAGGYGMLTRLMRDYGFNFYWSDPFCENILARGFQANEHIDRFYGLTAFEVLEHTDKPVDFFQQMMSDNHCKTVLFTTQLHEGKVPDPSWWYYAFNEGQHISFYTKKTLETIAKNLGIYFHSSNGIHYFSEKPINKFMFNLLAGRLSSLFFIYVSRRMSSLTFSDHQQLIGGK